MSASGDPLQIVKRRFPNLSSGAQISSPPTPRYNCIAFAAGDITRWWWPDALGMDYWPPGCVRLPTLPAFQMAFETLGYELCASEAYEPEYEKIAIFHKHNVPTHGARQIGANLWTSKLGKWFDIEHSISEVGGYVADGYGDVAFFMRRKKP